MSDRRVRRGVLAVAIGVALFLSLALSATVGAYCPPGVVAGRGYPAYIYPRAVYQPYYAAYAPVAYGYQYTDNRFCGDGQVTATPQGYFCTNSGVPAYRSDGAVTYNYVTPYVAPRYYPYWYR